MTRRNRNVIWSAIAITLLLIPVAAALFQFSRPTPQVAADAGSDYESPFGDIVYPTDPWTTQPIIPGLSGLKPLRASDLSGKLHQLGASPDCQAVVVIFLGTQCPISNSILPRINQLAVDYAGGGVEIYGVISSWSVSLMEAREHSAEFEVAFPVIFDGSRILRHELRATHTPHAFVLSPDHRRLYSGAFDDQFPSVTRRRQQPLRNYVREALEDILSHRDVQTVETDPVGCHMESDRSTDFDGKVTYNRDIAPIIDRHCVTCHRTGAVAPFPLESYTDVVRHVQQIREVVMAELMPPWKPYRGFGQFRGEAFLTSDEKLLISTWVENGSREGNPADLPNPPQFPDGWRLGRPDLIIDIPAFQVPADGPDIYQYFVVPSGLTEDRLVTAIEYRVNNPQLVHHASFRYDDAGEARRLDALDPGPGYRNFGGWGFETGGTLGGWAVGIMPQRLPDDYCRPLRVGSDFVVQTHYHPNGRPATDAGRVGIYFAPKTSKRRIGELFVANIKLKIPPDETELIHRAEYTVPSDTVVHGVLPHTHLLGRQVWAAAFQPDGSVEPLIWINDWDFNWQSSYQYAEPLHLPSGTKIVFDVFFDNSADNPVNPHSPPEWVYWGEASTDEMAVCYFDVSTPDDADLDALIRHNRESINRQLDSTSH